MPGDGCNHGRKCWEEAISKKIGFQTPIFGLILSGELVIDELLM